MSFTALLAAPFVAYAAYKGLGLGVTVLGMFARKPLVGLAFAGVTAVGVGALPAEAKDEIASRADQVIEAPAQLGVLIDDLAEIVEDGNSQVASAADYADDELGEMYQHESDRYGQTYQRILGRLLESFGDIGAVLALEDDDGTLYEEDPYAPGDV